MSIQKMNLGGNNTNITNEDRKVKHEYYDKLIAKTTLNKSNSKNLLTEDDAIVETEYQVGEKQKPALVKKSSGDLFFCKDLRDKNSVQSKIMSVAKLTGDTIKNITTKIQKKIKRTGESSIILSGDEQKERLDGIKEIKEFAELVNGTKIGYVNIKINYRKISFSLIISDNYGNQLDTYIIDYPSRTVILPKGECFDSLFEDIKIMADRFALLLINMIEGKTAKSTVFNQYKVVKFTVPNEVIFIQNKQFNRAKSLKEVVFHEKVKEIGDNAFAGCKVLERIIGIEKVEFLNKQVLKGCINIISIDLSGARVIGDGSLEGCPNLESVKLSDKLVVIPKSMFKYDVKLSNVNFGKELSIIDDKAFCGTNLSDIEFNSDLEEIGSDAFSWCKNLTTVEFNNIKNIKDYAFFCCANLSNVKFNGDLSQLYKYVFSGCGSLTRVKLNSDTIYDDTTFEENTIIEY